jgi:hypothetical protein
LNLGRNVRFDVMRTLLSLTGLPLVGAFLTLAACGGPDPKMVAAKNDGVPANSASEERLKAGEKKEEPKATHDPSQPYTQPVTGGGGSGDATPGGPKEVGANAGKRDPKEKPGAAGKGSKDKVPKADCTKALDRGLDLMMSGDSRFEGIPPEMIAQFKQQGLSQVGGPNPCDGQGLTKTQYDCAMTAPTSSAWQRCIK